MGLADALETLSLVKNFSWLKPREQIDLHLVEQLVYEHLRALRRYGYRGYPNLRVLVSCADWYLMGEAFRCPDWVRGRDIARFKAHYSYKKYKEIENYKWEKFWNRGRDCSRKCIYETGARHLWGSSYGLAGNASARASWDVAGLVAHQAVNCALPDPWAPLVELWSLGCAPAGVICAGGDFVVYVPEATS